MMNRKKPIGPVPVRLPRAKPQFKDENPEPLVFDPKDPDIADMIKSMGEQKVREICESEQEDWERAQELGDEGYNA
jgi:hypothetical protein